ncbi:hypothetical protein [Glycomyces rhizosphaerae]|uniref:Uncharacterized protein n=1 Tax=Glycomyces rhizosphaerae TaxID=2054422 RepID=A0ABV7Q2C8_9ACTN
MFIVAVTRQQNTAAVHCLNTAQATAADRPRARPARVDRRPVAIWGGCALTGCETSLARVIAEETGRDADELPLRLLARFVLEIPDLAGTDPDPAAALDIAFAHLQRPDL